MDIENFSRDQIRIIAQAIENNFNPAHFDNNQLDPWQMREISNGLLENVDVSIYAKPEYSPEQMEFLRDTLAHEIVSPEKIKEYLTPEFSVNQYWEIYEGLFAGIEPKDYANPKLTPDEMYIIRCSIKENLDTKLLSNLKDLEGNLILPTQIDLLAKLHDLRVEKLENEKNDSKGPLNYNSGRAM